MREATVRLTASAAELTAWYNTACTLVLVAIFTGSLTLTSYYILDKMLLTADAGFWLVVSLDPFIGV